MPSSVIKFFRYNAAARTLAITFISGRLYHYHNVPENVYAAMRSALSKGEFFNKYIKDQYAFTAES